MRVHVLAKSIPLVCLGLFVAVFGGQMFIYHHAEAVVSLGIDDYNQGAYAGAEPQMRAALGLNPDNAYASYYLGLCLLRDGNISEAKRRLQTAQTIASGSKFMEWNEPPADEASAALNRLGNP